jgi:hypothetical protein
VAAVAATAGVMVEATVAATAVAAVVADRWGAAVDTLFGFGL